MYNRKKKKKGKQIQREPKTKTVVLHKNFVWQKVTLTFLAFVFRAAWHPHILSTHARYLEPCPLVPSG